MEISSSNVKYSENFIDTIYDYQTTVVEQSNGKLMVRIECPIITASRSHLAKAIFGKRVGFAESEETR